MKPFLKWAGNKYAIVDRIKRRLPVGTRLIEPFVGSGALFLNTRFSEYHLADSNPDLIGLYQILQAEGDPFIVYAQTFFEDRFNQEERYYELRDSFNTTDDPRRKAALFLYLNRHGYNGLCRYNSKGVFNSPFGRYRKPYFPEKEMRFFHEKARNATFLCADFAETLSHAMEGDVVYCDPPYVPLSRTANFTSYHTGGFGKKEQEALAAWAERLAGAGVPVLISNHDTPFTRDVYASARITALKVQRYISCQDRGKAKEVLALFGGRA